MSGRPYIQPKHFVIPPDAREKAAETMDHLASIIGPRPALAMLRAWMLLIRVGVIIGYVLVVAWALAEVDVDQWHEPYIAAIGLAPMALHIWHSIRAIAWVRKVRLAEDFRGTK